MYYPRVSNFSVVLTAIAFGALFMFHPSVYASDQPERLSASKRSSLQFEVLPTKRVKKGADAGPDPTAENEQNQKGIYHILQQANEGDPTSRNKILDCVWNFEPIELSNSKLIAWLEAEAQGNNIKAQFALFCFASETVSDSRAAALAHKFYRGLKQSLERMSQQDPGALTALGYIYRKGLRAVGDTSRIEPEPQKAEACFNKAFAAGDAAAATHLGNMYCHGVKGADGQFLLPPDAEEAKQWYEKAFNAGLAIAANDLATMYYLGVAGADGQFLLHPNHDQARQRYEKAFAAGHVAAATHLGDMYECGVKGAAGQVLLPPNAEEAKQWFEKAFAAGHVAAATHLGDMNQYGVKGADGLFLLHPNPDQAKQWYEEAFAKGYAPAATDLGNMYQLGVKRADDQFLLNPDLETAEEWYTKAYEAGHRATDLFIAALHLVNSRPWNDKWIKWLVYAQQMYPNEMYPNAHKQNLRVHLCPLPNQNQGDPAYTLMQNIYRLGQLSQQHSTDFDTKQQELGIFISNSFIAPFDICAGQLNPDSGGRMQDSQAQKQPLVGTEFYHQLSNTYTKIWSTMLECLKHPESLIACKPARYNDLVNKQVLKLPLTPKQTGAFLTLCQLENESSILPLFNFGLKGSALSNQLWTLMDQPLKLVSDRLDSLQKESEALATLATSSHLAAIAPTLPSAGVQQQYKDEIPQLEDLKQQLEADHLSMKQHFIECIQASQPEKIRHFTEAYPYLLGMLAW